MTGGRGADVGRRVGGAVGEWAGCRAVTRGRPASFQCPERPGFRSPGADRGTAVRGRADHRGCDAVRVVLPAGGFLVAGLGGTGVDLVVRVGAGTGCGVVVVAAGSGQPNRPPVVRRGCLSRPVAARLLLAVLVGGGPAGLVRP